MALTGAAPVRRERDAADLGGTGIAVGDRGARLLAGPVAEVGAESLPAHLARVGPLPPLAGADRDLRALVARSGLTGRGGGGFATAVKLRAVAERPGWPLVVANGSESEPASRKDRTLMALRPHLVLDGAAVAAACVRAAEAVIVVHGETSRWAQALRHAIVERQRRGEPGPEMRIVVAPPRYVAGESSAIRSLLEGGPAIPRPVPGGDRGGVDGRPTLVQNVETVAHLALLVRQGAEWFREAGSERAPGSHLVTLTGGVMAAPHVLELVRPVTLGRLLRGPDLGADPAAVLLGGYGGAWVDAVAQADLRLDRAELATHGLPFGCGLVGILPEGACGLAETARILSYLARETAGQCGPCQFGLPAIARSLARLAAGQAGLRELDRIRARAARVAGRGACHHPDGAVSLALSALSVFRDDVERHLGRGPCRGAAAAPTFPVPEPCPAAGCR